jgi:hypothetical protein
MWGDINKETVDWVSKMPPSQLLVCCCVILKMKGRLAFLPPWVVGQQLTFANRTMLWALTTTMYEMLELDN